MKKLNIFLLAGLLGLIQACGSTEKEDATKAEEKAKEQFQEESSSNEIEEESESAQYFLPSALQIGSVFQRSGLKYVEGVINSPDNAPNYATKAKKLLNFGVYSADLAYCILNDQNQEAVRHLKGLKELSEGIGLNSIFDSEDMFVKFEKNMGNKDSVIDVMISIQEKTDMYIDDNNLHNLANIIFAGAWIEGMYIGVKATNDEDRHKITGRLLEQMVILDNLIKALNADDTLQTEVKTVLASLGDLKEYYENLEGIKGKQNISFKEIEIPLENLQEIADRVSAMRDSIVNA